MDYQQNLKRAITKHKSIGMGSDDDAATASLTKEGHDDDEPPSLVSSFSSDSLCQSGGVMLTTNHDHDLFGGDGCRHQSPGSVCVRTTQSKFLPIVSSSVRLLLKRRMERRCESSSTMVSVFVTTSFCLLGLLFLYGYHSIMRTRVPLLPSTPNDSIVTTAQFQLLLRRVRFHSHHPQYTVLIRGDRLDATFRSVQRYLDCPNALAVAVHWTSNDEDVPPLLASFNADFAPVATDAIVALDERQIVSCEDLDRSFAVWRADPSRWVGDFDNVMVVHKRLLFGKTPQWNHPIPVLGISRRAVDPPIWYLGKRYYHRQDEAASLLSKTTTIFVHTDTGSYRD